MNCPMCGEPWNNLKCDTCGWFEGKQQRYSPPAERPDAPAVTPACQKHGDPLICLACESDEDRVWDARGYVTQRFPKRPADPAPRAQTCSTCQDLQEQVNRITNLLRNATQHPVTGDYLKLVADDLEMRISRILLHTHRPTETP